MYVLHWHKMYPQFFTEFKEFSINFIVLNCSYITLNLNLLFIKFSENLFITRKLHCQFDNVPRVLILMFHKI